MHNSELSNLTKLLKATFDKEKKLDKKLEKFFFALPIKEVHKENSFKKKIQKEGEQKYSYKVER